MRETVALTMALQGADPSRPTRDAAERALDKLEAQGTAVEVATWGTAHLWLADPVSVPDDASDATRRMRELFGIRIPLAQRSDLMAVL